jgi:hypothetical protein
MDEAALQTPVTLAFGKQRQEDEFQASLDYILRLWEKKKKKRKKKEKNKPNSTQTPGRHPSIMSLLECSWHGSQL